MKSRRGQRAAAAAPRSAAAGKRRAAAERALTGADVEVLEAALAVHRHIELDGQLAEIARCVGGWAGAVGAVALVGDEDGRGLVPIAESLGIPGPLLDRLKEGAAAVSMAEAARYLGRFEGLGPFDRGRGRSVVGACRLLAVRRADERAAALLLVIDPERDDDPRIDRLELAARTALSNAAQVRAIRDLTIRDDTADCFNRRFFEEFLVEEIARASRFKTPMSLIFFDMDNLKEVNSRFGHAMGSRSLLEVSQRVRSRVRKFDKLFRFGGDEFCVVLPETEWHGALEVAERVREAISSRPMLVRELGEGRGQPMTASFGIASFPLHARTKEELVVRADRAMQSVKNTTKNGIAVSELEGHGVR